MKKLGFLSLPIATILLIGAACSPATTTKTNIAATNTAVTTNVPSGANEAATLSVIMLLNNGNGSPIRTFNTTVPADTTALGLLQKVTTENTMTLDTKTSSYGTYVNGIGGLTGNDKQYWLFYVNNKAASVGVDSYVLQNNDIVELRYGSGSSS